MRDLMTSVLSFDKTPDTRPSPVVRGFSAPLLTRLLVSHEDMIAQLCVERAEAVTNANFLSSMIDQHETAAAMLRAHLELIAARRVLKA